MNLTYYVQCPFIVKSLIHLSFLVKAFADRSDMDRDVLSLKVICLQHYVCFSLFPSLWMT